MFGSIVFQVDWTRGWRLAKESLSMIVGQLSVILGSLGLVRVLSEYLDPTQYGQLALGLTVAGLINQVITGGIQNAIARFYTIAVEKQDVKSYLLASHQLLLYASLIISVVGFVGALGLFYFGYKTWIAPSLMIGLFSILSAYRSAISGIQNAARQRALGACLAMIDNVMRIVVVLLMIRYFNASMLSVLLAYVVASLLLLMLQGYFFRNLICKKSLQTHATWLKEMWTFAWPFATWGILGWIQQSAPRFALESFRSTADVGLFSILSQLGYTPVQTTIGFVVAFLTPVLFSRVGDARCQVRVKNSFVLVNKMVLFGLFLTLFLVLLMMLGHQLVFRLFSTSEYESVSGYLPWVVLSGGLFSMAQIYSTQLMALMSSHRMIAASIGSSVVGTLAAYAGVWLAGLQGAVMALLIHAMTYFIWIFISVRHFYKTGDV